MMDVSINLYSLSLIQRKTVAANDVYQAIKTMQCEQLEKPVSVLLEKRNYR